MRKAGLGVAKAGLGVANAGLRVANAGLGVAKAGLRVANAGLGVAKAGLGVAKAGLQVANAGLRLLNLRKISSSPQKNIIHRDIKPQKLMRRRQDGKIVLIDFRAVSDRGSVIKKPYPSRIDG